MAQRTCVMDGQLKDFSIHDIIEVLSVSRQQLLLQISADSFLGEMIVKAGKVLAAKTGGGASGKKAALDIVRHGMGRQGTFGIYQIAPLKRKGAPIESFIGLMERGNEAPDVSEAPSSPPAGPRKPPMPSLSPPSNALATRVVGTGQIEKPFDTSLLEAHMLKLSSRIEAIEIEPLSERVVKIEESLVRLIKDLQPALGESIKQEISQLAASIQDVRTAIREQEQKIDRLGAQSGQGDSGIMTFAREMIERQSSNKLGVGLSVGVLALQVLVLLVTCLTWLRLFSTP